jgi:hypothetical protein
MIPVVERVRQEESDGVFKMPCSFLERVGFFRGNPILEHEIHDLDQTEASVMFSHNLDLKGRAGPSRILSD